MSWARGHYQSIQAPPEAKTPQLHCHPAGPQQRFPELTLVNTHQVWVLISCAVPARLAQVCHRTTIKVGCKETEGTAVPKALA